MSLSVRDRLGEYGRLPRVPGLPGLAGTVLAGGTVLRAFAAGLAGVPARCFSPRFAAAFLGMVLAVTDVFFLWFVLLAPWRRWGLHHWALGMWLVHGQGVVTVGLLDMSGFARGKVVRQQSARFGRLIGWRLGTIHHVQHWQQFGSRA